MPTLTPEEKGILTKAEEVLRAAGVYYVHLPIDRGDKVTIDSPAREARGPTLVEAVTILLDPVLYSG